MIRKLHFETVSSLLLNALKKMMDAEELKDFRLVGGTALSLYCGHRQSIDIDLFTDAEYGAINFDKIDQFLRKNYSYVQTSNIPIISFGKSYYLGENIDNCIKLDLFYTDKYIDKIQIIDGIRLASIEEIIAMKIDVVQRGGRKKDFWDIHELMTDFTFSKMLAIHEKRYPFIHDPKLIRQNFTDFSSADQDFDPICLRGNYWELIKLDMIEFVK
jgi:hypothetical protein